MRKTILLLLMSCFALGSFVSCSDDDDDFVNVTNADKVLNKLYKLEIDHDQTVVYLDLDVESNTNWAMTKENEKQTFWSLKQDFSDNDAHLKGDGNKNVRVYFFENLSEWDRTAIISIHKGISKKNPHRNNSKRKELIFLIINN